MGILTLAVVVTAGAIGTGYHLASTSPSKPSTSIDALPVASPSPSPEQGTDLAAVSPAPPKSVDVMDLPSAPVARTQPAKPIATASAERPAETAPRTGSDATSLGDELRAIDDARAAFVENNPKLALDRVDSYRRRFPTGHFMDEAEALEIQALVALGRNEEAQTKADRFLAAHPASPYAQRVRSAVGVKK